MISVCMVFFNSIPFFFNLASDVRLANGQTPHEGRLEIKHNNQYGAVCSRNFGMVDAQVVCSMLGYNNP